MSDGQTRTGSVFQCSAGDCSIYAGEDEMIRGSFCSLDCFHRTKGENALRKIKHDHRFCSSCFRVRKEIEYPPDSFIAARSKLVGESLIGEETLTPHMTVASGIVYCRCGTIDHDSEDETLRDLDAGVSHSNLLVLLRQLSDESQIHNPPSPPRFYQTLIRSENDLALSVGAAIYD